MPGNGALVFRARQTIRPIGSFVLFVAFAFLLEWVVMVCLPGLVDPERHTMAASLLDSGILVLVLGPLAWLMFMVPLARLNDLKTRLLNKLIEAQEETLGRIARDLHDGVGQSVTGLLVGIRAIEETSGEPGVRQMLMSLREQGAAAHEELRRLVRGLRPYQLDELGLGSALKLEADTLMERASVFVEFHAADGTGGRWPRMVESALYRIAQEAIANALEHGKPRNILIRIFRDPDGLGVEITDDGGGFDIAAAWAGTESRRPFGLLSMRERATLLGGSFSVDSRPGFKTVVRALIPVEGPIGANHGG